jgi:3-hydroxybutyryl-CoA dehydrogenase
VRETIHARIEGNLGGLGLDPAIAQRVRVEAELEPAVDGVDWVFEAAPERLELKQQVFARLDALTGPDVVLASNSSVVRVGDVAAQATGRNRIVGTHWWNPP